VSANKKKSLYYIRQQNPQLSSFLLFQVIHKKYIFNDFFLFHLYRTHFFFIFVYDTNIIPDLLLFLRYRLKTNLMSVHCVYKKSQSLGVNLPVR